MYNTPSDIIQSQQEANPRLQIALEPIVLAYDYIIVIVTAGNTSRFHRSTEEYRRSTSAKVMSIGLRKFKGAHRVGMTQEVRYTHCV